MIGRECAHALAGEARIIVKLNALAAGRSADHRDRCTAHRRSNVKIDLIVRGVCAVRPGIPRRIRQYPRDLSVVGRFLEHSRAYWFENDGLPELYLSSADWMERNFFRRVEIAFPVQQPQHRKRILKDLETLLSDNTNAWELQADGTYARLSFNQSTPVDAQALLLERYAGLPVPQLAIAVASATLSRYEKTRNRIPLRPQELRSSSCRSATVQRMLLQPACREAQLQRAAARAQFDIRQCDAATSTVQQHRQPQQHDQLHRAPIHGGWKVLQSLAPRACGDGCPPDARAIAVPRVRIPAYPRSRADRHHGGDNRCEPCPERSRAVSRPLEAQLGERIAQVPTAPSPATGTAAPWLRPAPPAPDRHGSGAASN